MKTKTQQILYKIDRIALRVLYFTVAAMFVLAALWFTAGIGSRYAWIILGSIATICIVCRICLSPFVKSEEQEAFELACIPTLAVGYGKMHRSAQTYNSQCTTKSTPYWSLQLDNYGLGLAYHF